MTVEEPRIRITERAVEALRAEGIEPSGSFLVIRHILGCGGSGYRITWSERPLSDGWTVEAGGGVRVSMDDYSYARLSGAAIDYDTEKETEGFLLDHPDAAFAAFC